MYVTPTPQSGDGAWTKKDFTHKDDGQFSHSEYVKYQAAIKAVVQVASLPPRRESSILTT